MSMMTNSPAENLLLRLERRKSFSLGIHIMDSLGRSLDIEGCSLRLAAQKRPFSSNTLDNMIVSDEATLLQPESGYAQFDLQAYDLDHPAGEYEFTIVLQDPEGYSSVIAKGLLEVQDNPEIKSIESEYESVAPPSTLEIRRRGQNIIAVAVGHALIPGTTVYTIEEQEKLAELDPALQLPTGGFPGNVLTRSGATGTKWSAAPAGSGGGLVAEGVPEGFLPTADGEDSWNWATPPEDGVTSLNGLKGDVILTLENIQSGVDRFTVSAEEKDILPLIDTAAFRPEAYFRKSSDALPASQINGLINQDNLQKVMGLRGIQSGTALPATGWIGTPEDGDIYFQVDA